MMKCRIWPPLDYFTWEGLRRYGKTELAAELADRTWRMFRSEWDTKRQCRENFHISDPAGHATPDSDPFYSWGALVPMMAACEIADVSPWSGLTLGSLAGGDAELALPGRRWSSKHDAGRLAIALNGRQLLGVTAAARVSRLEADGRRIAFSLPSSANAASVVDVVGARTEDILLARVDGVDVACTSTGNSDATIACPSGAQDVEIVLAKGSDA